MPVSGEMLDSNRRMTHGWPVQPCVSLPLVVRGVRSFPIPHGWADGLNRADFQARFNPGRPFSTTKLAPVETVPPALFTKSTIWKSARQLVGVASQRT